MEDWLKYKPYEIVNKSDIYYNGVVFGVRNELKLIEHNIKSLNFSDQDYKDLSVFLVSYLEDLVSETNFWITFVNLHKATYGKYLPFFNPTKDYKIGKVNLEDVNFLIWYFVNCKLEGSFVGPQKDLFEYISNAVYPILNLEFDFAPKNELLKQIYVLEDNPNFYQSRLFIDKIMFFSYLFSHDLRKKLDCETQIILKSNSNKDYKEQILKEFRDTLLLDSVSKLLCVYGNNWAAELLGKNHKNYQLLNKSYKKFTSWFIFKSKNEKYIVLEHIASGKTLNLLKISYDNHLNLYPNCLVFLGLANYDDEWWFSGVSMTQNFDVKFVNEEKNSMESLKKGDKISYDLEEAYKATLEHYEYFKDFTNGKEIVFLEKDKIDAFNNDYVNYQNFKISTKRNLEGSDFKPTKESGKYQPSIIKNKNVEPGFVYFNPKRGLEIGHGLNSAFPDIDNPFYNEKEENEDVKFIIYSPDFSTEIIHFILEKYKNKLKFLKTDTGKIILKDLDFVLKFTKGNEYFSTPNISFK